MAVVVLTVPVASSVGCSDSGGALRREPEISSLLTIPDIHSFVLPLDKYSMNPEQWRILQKARRELLGRCVGRFGLKFIPQQGVGSSRITQNGDRYGISRADVVSTHGYHPAEIPQAQSVQGIPQATPDVDGVVQGTLKSFGGKLVPEGGCSGEADRILGHGAPEVPSGDKNLVRELSLRSFGESQGDSRVRAVFKSWSDCMRSRGFEYDNPREANNDRAFQSDKPSEREMAVAMADVKCKSETNLIAIWATVETAYQEQYIVTYGHRLQVFEQSIDTALRNAAGVRAP
ncbi:hypothetical protein [Micromonospora sp. 4G55]|uniref:hypothetical protein n=1 Tax=Micromonospora sp. 4G55 TaxID=2806102 RepID=UPI001A528481|nr:hypothetical protein [Micromonospora sp. 4G55]MBM0259299.1 hypothetical protein [Micromonospora sp. 4G55]